MPVSELIRLYESVAGKVHNARMLTAKPVTHPVVFAISPQIDCVWFV
jgi:hypothetical protein